MEAVRLAEAVATLAEVVTVVMAQETAGTETGTEDVDDTLIDGLVAPEDPAAVAIQVMDQVVPRSRTSAKMMTTGPQ